jgi:hypothetical protein
MDSTELDNEIKKSKRGGKRPRAGRKSKADEQKLKERLSPYENGVHRKLKAAIDNGERWAIQLYFNYMYGKPRETKDITLNAEQPLFEL